MGSVREVIAAEDHQVTSNEIFYAETPDQATAATGVPLRPATAARLADVDYTHQPLGALR